MDACELIKETERELRNLENKKAPVILGKVKGSNPDFPYQERGFTMRGTGFGIEEDKEFRRKKEILAERKKKAESVKLEVEEWINGIPMRMQRIIKHKILEGMTWEETAAKMGRKATGESVKKEFQRFLQDK